MLRTLCIALFLALVPLAAGALGQPVTGRSVIFVVNDDAVGRVPSISAARPTSVPTALPTSPAPSVGTLDPVAQTAAIVQALRRRGFGGATATFAKYLDACSDSTTESAPVALHWILAEANPVRNYKLVGLTDRVPVIHWAVSLCSNQPAEGNLSPAEMSYRMSSSYNRPSVRVPLSSIMALVALTNGVSANAIHAPLIAGFSSGVGAVNTYLDFVDPQDGLLEQSFLASADKVAADFCGMKLADGQVFRCLKAAPLRP